MVNCICKVCKNGLSELVNSLAQFDSIEKIIQTLKDDYDLDCNSYTLKRHLDTFGIAYQSILDRTPVMGIEEASGRYHQQIDLNELSLSRWGLSPENPAEVVSFLQEKLLVLSLQQVEIVASQQKAYLEGDTFIEPSKESISNLRTLLSLTDKFTAISLQANQQQAVRIVQALGYEAEDLKSLPSNETLNP